MKNFEIGTVGITYDKQGTATKAEFNPTVGFNLDTNVIKQLASIKQQDPEILKQNAGFVMAAWFSKLNDIELADRDKYEIATEIVSCDRYSDGKIKMCRIRFTFKELSRESA